MRKAIVIPVYLRLNKPEELLSSQGLSLAKRAIQSLRILEDQDFTLILPVGFDLTGKNEEPSISEMDHLLRKEIQGLREEKTFLFSSNQLKSLRRYLDQKGFRKFSSLIDLKGFSKIRNTGLLLAQALSMDAVIFIDSDEVVEDPSYLMIACEYLNQKWNGKLVVGKGGFYVNPDGAILLSPQHLWWRFLWNKTKWMNRVWEQILASRERLIFSPMLLGGNLVLHQHLFRSVPFDPFIPRGEDTDYLINASQMGFCLLFDKALRIKHLHPKRTEVYFHEELKGDIGRFLYEREKVRVLDGINLIPYPGYFLKWTLYPKAILTSFFLSLDYLGRRDWGKAKGAVANLALLFQKRDGGWLNYLKFKRDWEMVMSEIQRDGIDKLMRYERI